MANGLYDNVEYFLLLYNFQEWVIEEPVGWDKMQVSTPRDKDTYGFISQFMDSEGQLQFVSKDGCGGLLIEAWVNTLGSDIDVRLQFGLLEGTTRYPLFEGSLLLSDYNRDDIGVTVTVQRNAFNDTLRTRFASMITVSSDKDLDNNTIVPLTPFNIELHSKQIVKQTLQTDGDDAGTIWQDRQTLSIGNVPPKTHVWLQPDTQSLDIEELDTVPHYPAGLSDTDPATRGAFIYEAVEGGFLEIAIITTGELITGTTNSITSGTYELFHYRGPSNISHVTLPLTVFGIAFGSAFGLSSPNTTLADRFNLTVEPGDQVFLGLKINVDFTANATLDITNFSNYIKLTQYTIAPKSISKAYKIFDVLNQLVYAATGLQDRVISEFFGIGGAGEKYALLNGYAIRNFTDAAKPFQLNMENATKAIQTLWNIGVGYRRIDGDDYVVFEPMMEFFKQNPILFIEPYSYKEKVIKDYSFNELALGYDKYAQEELNTLDEFATEQTILMPLKNIKAKKSSTCPFIASGFLLEVQRREQFKVNPSTSLDADDDVFIVSYTDKTVYKRIYYASFVGPKELWFSVDVGLVPGDSIILKNNTFNNNVTFTILSPIIATNAWGYVVAEVPTAITGGQELTDVEIVPSAGGLKIAERNENFEILDGVISPGSVYNARLSLKHLAYSWSPLINIGVAYKDDAEVIITTFSKSNNEFRTKFNATATHTLYVGTQTIKEKDNIVLSNYGGRVRPFLPIGADIETEMGWQDVLLLQQALFGELEDSDDRNNGCVVVTDDKGITWYMHVLSLGYDFKRQIATMQVARIEEY